MSKTGSYDGLILGGVLGLIISYPSIGNWILDLLDSVIPSTWDWFGSYSLTVFVVAIGCIIGFIVDKTR
ncbi:MAG: hypothetical protein KKB31_00430 [Nanoarchaeota archaeon]|nr:hypothetical protein [Nanoarchaeota archaeon]